MVILYTTIFIALLVGIIAILIQLIAKDDLDEDVFIANNDNNDYMRKL